jgi:3-oxoacyl-[acyl-carrier protein] reductase
LKLAEQGIAVVVNARSSAAAAEEVVAAITAAGGQGIAVLADVSQAPEVARLTQTALDTYGRIDILVNNAGIVRDQLLVRMSEEEWDQVLDINLKGAFLCTRAVLRPMLRQRWGRIINITSVSGIVGNAGQANYTAAKAGLIALTRTTAKEVASRNITVNAVAPGYIDTDMTRALPDNVKQEALQRIPAGYFGTPQDVAHAVAFLASEEARYITGQVLGVDGGMVMV